MLQHKLRQKASGIDDDADNLDEIDHREEDDELDF